MIMMATPVAMLFLRPIRSPKIEVATEPKKHPTVLETSASLSVLLAATRVAHPRRWQR